MPPAKVPGVSERVFDEGYTPNVLKSVWVFPSHELGERCLRRAEVDLLLGDANRALQCLNWSAETTYRELARDMASSDLDFYLQINGADAARLSPAHSSQPKLQSTGDR